ncbi:glutamate--tRNA ligase [Candidatus Berkiella aquae]|uniref:Glutamate--tRNA ligase n=1 Tax=Candidatus Berkiella aquae TaxID=295108 RepID=A0A0Q9YP12_9GAMM|nr:glutamate--tRNA ligase [Candidatus Berkiella aquae]MCS5712086.1 glutamate--tRNA ligase [Candidatus Berkiella aquae]
MTITRFAPSPTGMLHVGSARTALFCWLWAKRQKGTFILRIEDTDRERSTDEAVEVIIEGLKWLELNWDEGPIFQTHRFDRYKAVLKELMANDHAYKCYCTKERLEALREQQIEAKEKPRYDGYCRKFPAQPHADTPYVVRFKTPEEGSIVFEDLVRGRIEIQNSELDDLILARSDGTPTYNFTVVIDDWDMKVTHVLRGDDHINNTPRQIHIFKALNAPMPAYGHMPMLLGPDGKRLSKRHGAVSVLQYRDEGILPKALINYLVRLGWSHGDQEIFTTAEMIEHFDVHNINVAPTALNPEKLLWLNQHYMKTEPEVEVAKQLAWFMAKLGIDLTKGPDLAQVVIAQRERCKTLVEMAEKSRFFFEDEVVIDGDLTKKHFNREAVPALSDFIQALEAFPAWDKEVIHDALKAAVDKHGIKLGVLAPVVRLAASGTMASPPIDMMLWLLGKEKTVARLSDALAQLKELA